MDYAIYELELIEAQQETIRSIYDRSFELQQNQFNMITEQTNNLLSEFKTDFTTNDTLPIETRKVPKAIIVTYKSKPIRGVVLELTTMNPEFINFFEV